MFAPDNNVDRNGKTPSGHPGEALVISTSHAEPTCVGESCVLGAQEKRPFIEDTDKVTDAFVPYYSNTGLSNTSGFYVEQFAREGLVNGGDGWSIAKFQVENEPDIATRTEEYNDDRNHFIEATKTIKKTCPRWRVSGRATNSSRFEL